MAADEYTRGALAALDALAGAFQDLAAEASGVQRRIYSPDDIVQAIQAARAVVERPPTVNIIDLARQAARNTARRPA